MNVAFLAGYLNERGTTVALYDYAHFNEMLLHNKSLILVRSGQEPEAMDRFVKRFDVAIFDDMDDASRLISEKDIDVCYLIEYGRRFDNSYSLPRGLQDRCPLRIQDKRSSW
jgi:hypothetical protein